MSEDRMWARDPIFLERERRTLADIRQRADALALWLKDAHAKVAHIERQLARARTAELGHYEPNDEMPA